MAIAIIDGYAGHGKTAYAVSWMRDLLAHGERIFPDIKLYPAKMRFKFDASDIEGNLADPKDRENPEKRILYWKHFEEWEWMSKGTILCDEGGVKFNSRNFERLPEDIQNKIQQHRHDRLDLILTAPHWSRIDVLIRQMAERFLHTSLFMGSEKYEKTFFPRITRITERRYEDMVRIENLGEDSNLVAEPISKTWFWIRERYFDWYDTGEIVGSSRTPHSLVCEICGRQEVRHKYKALLE